RQQKKEYLSLEEARQNKLSLDWNSDGIFTPRKPGIHQILDQELELLLPYIDWTPFFRSWDLHGRFPNILEDPVVGEQATELYKDAQQMLQQLISEKLLQARAVFGIFEANSLNDDDIEIVVPSEGISEKKMFHTLRQQSRKAKGRPNLALADFIAPKETGVTDYMGCFCVTAGFGTDELALKFEQEHDDYNSIMVKALADRLVEAFAEYLHEQVRKKFWGYAANEELSNTELISESYQGIRPAPGYPACPDHLEKETIWDILKVEETIGVSLTESLAMWPAASVSGYYFGNAEAKYFGLGKIREDQVKDYASRKGISEEKAFKWLQTSLAD
ncbi:MAG: methionine synthase, partial [Flavobacterium sp.]